MATKKQIKIEDNVAELLNEYAETQARIQADQERMWEIENLLSELEPGTYEGKYGDSVRVSGYTRLNTQKALSMLSDRSIAKVMVSKPDAALIRKHFPGVARKATSTYDNRVAIDVAERHLTPVI